MPSRTPGNGYARTDFTIDYDTRTVTCPQGRTSRSWTPCNRRGQAAAVATFATTDYEPCPARGQCTTSSKKRRQLPLLPHELAQAQATARATEKTPSFHTELDRRRTSHLARLDLDLAA